MGWGAHGGQVPGTLRCRARARAKAANAANVDELKNQWGRAGFTTRDIKRCQIMARIGALVFDWWNLFVRLANPDRHLEANTSRPLFLHAIAQKIRHAGQTILRIANPHGKAMWAAQVLAEVAAFLRTLKQNAERLTDERRWCRVLSHALRKFLKGRQLHPAPRLTTA